MGELVLVGLEVLVLLLTALTFSSASVVFPVLGDVLFVVLVRLSGETGLVGVTTGLVVESTGEVGLLGAVLLLLIVLLVVSEGLVVLLLAETLVTFEVLVADELAPQFLVVRFKVVPAGQAVQTEPLKSKRGVDP